MPQTYSNTDLGQKLIAYRRELHEYPELSFEEYETTKKLKKWLTDAGIELLDLPLKTGVLAAIRGNNPGPVIGLRADIDALPVQETTGLPFASKVPGKMHACGHDFHTASILGAALLLNEHKADLEGTVKIIFQPAEENGGGGRQVVDSGVLDDARAVFGMHDMPDLPTGTIGIKGGPLMAAVDRFTVDIEGVGTHAAAPQNGIDPIVVASHIITALQTIVSRNLSPLSSVVISVTRLEAGKTWNVVPPAAQFEGTVRTFEDPVRDRIPLKMEHIIKNIASGLGAKGTLHYRRIEPATVNDEKLAGWSRPIAEASGLKVITPDPSFAGEDFAEYRRKIPGVFFFMGVSGNSGLHHPDLIIDEKAILPSAKFFANLAVSMLKKVGNL